MDDDRFDQLTRRLDAAQTRRVTLGGLAALAAFAMAMDGADIDAKKKRKKKRKKKKPKQPTCAELCGFDCLRCFYRADAPPICGDNGGTTCIPCRSDSDCVGEDEPYCVTRIELQPTGSVSVMCGPDGGCDCAPGALGACVSATACTL